MKTATMKYVRQETKVGPIYKRVGELPKGTSYVRVESTPPNPITNGCPSVFSVARITRVLDEGAAKRQLKADVYTLIPVANPVRVMRVDRPARTPREEKPKMPKTKPEPKVAKPKAPKPEKVAGSYRPGTSFAKIYLCLADGKVHSEAELVKLVPTPSLGLGRRIPMLIQDGFDIRALKGDKYQMILGAPKPVAKAAAKPAVKSKAKKKGRK